MIPVTYARAADTADALSRGATDGARYLGGGTNLVDLMRETIERPTALVDVTGLPQHGHGRRQPASAHPGPLLL